VRLLLKTIFVGLRPLVKVVMVDDCVPGSADCSDRKHRYHVGVVYILGGRCLRQLGPLVNSSSRQVPNTFTVAVDCGLVLGSRGESLLLSDSATFCAGSAPRIHLARETTFSAGVHLIICSPRAPSSTEEFREKSCVGR